MRSASSRVGARSGCNGRDGTEVAGKGRDFGLTLRGGP